MNYIRWNIVGVTFDMESSAKVMQALSLTGGMLRTPAVLDGGNVSYQISLPEGLEEEFEQLAGYSLVTPEKEL